MSQCFCLTLLSIVLVLFNPVLSLECYQCSSNKDIDCAEKFDHSNTKLVPTTCDNVFEARFCVKTTGIYEGEIGTKRFCSARDYGDYCEYIKRLGDDRDYRSCVYTCSRGGCNGSQGQANVQAPLLLISALSSYLIAAALSR